MNAKTTIKTNVAERTIVVVMTGIYDEDAMRDACKKIHDATASFHGQPHLYLADMRGMKPAHPQVAGLLGQEIGWSRRNGVVLCAHLSDDTVQRLQTARVARQSTEGDDVTVDVASYKEAERVLAEARKNLLAGQAVPTASAMAHAQA